MALLQVKEIPIYLISSSRASSAVEKIFAFLEAKFDVSAATKGGTSAPDWLAKHGRILGRHCRARRLTCQTSVNEHK